MEKFNEKRYFELIFKYYDLMERNKTFERHELKKKYITNTVYEEYFQDKKLKKNEVIERIKKSFNKIKEYDLESIYLLGVSENKTEYMLPLIEKEIFLLAEKNNYEMQNGGSYQTEEIRYDHSWKLYMKFNYCGEYLYDYGTMLGAFEEFKKSDYRSVNEEDEKSFIEFIKILENHENYDVMTDKLYESDFFSVENGKKRKLSDEEIKEVDSELTDEEKEVYGGRSLGELINSSIDIFSIDYKRCTNIINGLWVLGIIRTSENMDGTYNYLEMIRKAGFGAWFFEDEYTIDYETIKKYFGKYKLIKEFCDERLEQQKNKEKNVIINYLNKVNKTKEFSIKEYKEIIKDFTYEEKKENLVKMSNYLEKEIKLEDVFVHADDDEKHKFTAEKMIEYFRSLLKPREETFDNIRQWLLETIHQEDKVEFPAEKLLNDTKMFDEKERMRTFNVLKNAVEKEDYKIKLKNGETLKGDNLVEYFGNLLGIVMIK